MEKHTNAPDKTNPSAETNQQNSSRSAAIPQAREEIIPPPKMTGDALSPAPVSPSPARYKLTIAFLCALLGFTFFVYASSSPASGLVLMTALLFGWLGMVIVVAVVADRQPGVTCQGGGGGRGGCLRREARELADGDAGRWDMERFHGGMLIHTLFGFDWDIRPCADADGHLVVGGPGPDDAYVPLPGDLCWTCCGARIFDPGCEVRTGPEPLK